MNAVTIRIADEALLRKLSAQADAHHRSVEREVMEILTSAVEQEGAPNDRLSIARRISAMTPKGVVQTDSTLLVREDRDRDE